MACLFTACGGNDPIDTPVDKPKPEQPETPVVPEEPDVPDEPDNPDNPEQKSFYSETPKIHDAVKAQIPESVQLCYIVNSMIFFSFQYIPSNLYF